MTLLSNYNLNWFFNDWILHTDDTVKLLLVINFIILKTNDNFDIVVWTGLTSIDGYRIHIKGNALTVSLKQTSFCTTCFDFEPLMSVKYFRTLAIEYIVLLSKHRFAISTILFQARWDSKRLKVFQIISSFVYWSDYINNDSNR